MLTNDIASLIQTEDKLAIVLKEPYTLKGLKLNSEEQICMLALYTSFIREKIGEKND